ncbi:hypothetical protein GDI55_22155 [Salmonella enterica subsp. enterica]|nr:hypothetical protein [Salmonella enterica subsp. enterica serovar Kambole]ECH9429767.1 hypothetical protein [Salmonella enterica subsp. enterica]EDY5135306.1 3'-5' exoribonuclease [Salmonella enterica subsp. enterica serovar Thompson]EDN3629619.1 hypothetical protein [Salmonella enterica subsp. enterica serovar Kambole]EDV4150256.1 3'-5' exoribonuclease [Salmonella enterica subsp. enterica]
MTDVFVYVFPLSKKTNAAPACFSAVFFDGLQGGFGNDFYIQVDVESSRQAGLDISPELLRAAMKSGANGNSVFSGENRCSLRLALHALLGFLFVKPETAALKTSPDSLRIWTNSPSIMSAALQCFGLDEKWNVHPLDFQTIVTAGDLLGLKEPNFSSTEPVEIAREHATYLAELLHRLNQKKRLSVVK